MSVGLYDMDIATYTLVPYNLEIMKLSSYYKKMGEIVVLSSSLTPDKYKKFFLRKDYDDGNFPLEIYGSDNLVYGGHAFSGEQYIPLPLEIEMMKPDTYIYEKYKDKILKHKEKGIKEKEKIYKNLTTAEHCRLSLDGKTIWKDYASQFKFLPSARNIIFHDYDLGKIEGACDEIKNILSKARTDGWATRVGMKFPVTICSGEDLLQWISLLPNSTFFFLKFNGIIDDDNFKKFIHSCKEKSTYTQMEYWITKTPVNSEAEFVRLYMQKIFRQIVLSRNQRVFFTLKYDDNFFTNKGWEKVIDLFNYYHNSYNSKPMVKYLKMIPTDTMFDFASKSKDIAPDFYNGKCFTKNQIRQIFKFVRENNYELFRDFYEYNLLSSGDLL